MKLLETAPQPNQPGRTPAAMFSLLKPKTSIPPHTGVSNVRLVTHVPLIVPPGCGFRVGNETREWLPGKAWVFDDTIEHEAWNRSDQLRVVLIFDIWHPQLSQAERNMITALAGAVTAFTGEVGGYDA
jgi:aspartyl/asparaginyl beta-hydroxylase (cupin superfamily)